MKLSLSAEPSCSLFFRLKEKRMSFRFATPRLSTLVVAATLVWSAVSAQENVSEYGEFPGVDGRAQAIVTVERGNIATLFVTARVSGGRTENR